MLRTMCKSKIHRVTVTDANLNYEGSITIDKSLMDAADMLPFEKVQIVNINNGSRAETYVMQGAPNSGTICMNGAIARLAQKGDLVIIISYAMFTEDELQQFKPKIVFVDKENKVTTK
ncbi:aspartate 1-decarboxylase [candidate division KSB1 bacterium]|nr:aspartate 1-decarboxylase [candidate division KSB1 bacterium]